MNCGNVLLAQTPPPDASQHTLYFQNEMEQSLLIGEVELRNNSDSMSSDTDAETDTDIDTDSETADSSDTDAETDRH